MELEFIQIQGQDGAGSWVPVVNQTLIHSTINPTKEASLLLDKEWDSIKGARSIIVFGLGGGFHIAELLKRGSFEVFVIEAEKKLISAMQLKWPELMAQIEVFADFPAHQLVGELNQLGAFSNTYAILKHPASVRLNPIFYRSIQHILNDRTLHRLREMASKNDRLSRFLDSLDINRDQILTLPMVEEALVRRGTGLDREALIWLALRELVV